jgi:hypothetical protein
MQGENDPAMSEGEEGPLLGGTEWVMVHARAPDVAPGLARQGIVDSAGQHIGTEGQQKLEDAVAEIIKVPAGQTEETMKRTEVLQPAQFPGLNDAREGTAAGAENPPAGQRPERGETGPGKAGLKSEQQGSKGADQEFGHKRVSTLSSLY